MELTEIRRELAAGRSIGDLPLRVAFYARVSTEKEEQLNSLKNQTEYYRAYIEGNRNWRFAGGFVDEGISGGSVEHRRRFLEMIRCAEAGEMDYIVTKEISRFSRDTLDSIRYTRRLLQFGVGVYFENDGINTLLPDAELRLTIMASLAQDERRRLSERVRFGFRRSIESGRVLGNNNIWGYEKADGALRIVEEEAEMVRRVFRYYGEDGMGLRAVARRLFSEGYCTRTGGELSTATVKSILRNPKYKGDYCGNKTSKVDYRSKEVRHLPPEQWKREKDHPAVPAIVPAAVWERANGLLDRRSREKAASRQSVGANARYPYSGRIFCGCCGAPYYRGVFPGPSGRREVWQCREYIRQGRKGCAGPAVYTEELDEAVGDYVRTLPLDFGRLRQDLEELFRRACGEEAAQDGERQSEVVRLRAAMDRLTDLAVSGSLSPEEFRRQSARYQGRLERLERQAAGPSEAEERQREIAGLTAAAEAMLNRLPSATMELLDGLDLRFTVTGKRENRRLQIESPAAETAEYAVFRSRGVFTVRRLPSFCCASDT